MQLRLSASPAAADPVADFYKGKTIQMVIGVSAGGDYDLRARLLAKHLPKYIPGNPNVVAQNMLGGGGLNAANWLANVAPKDGTVLLAISSTLPVSQAVGLKGIKFDVRKFHYIGNTTDSPNVINSWYTTGITKIEQVIEKELVVGSTGRSSGSYYYPAALNAWAGTKFKIVLGLSRRRQCQHRHGARRGRRPRLQSSGRRGSRRARNGSPRRRSICWSRSG